MIARVLGVPDDDASLPEWLDEQIAGPNLHEFVAELAAVHAAAPRPPATAGEAAAWLGDSLAHVLERGTSALDRRRLGDLLRTPHLLPGLQELAFVEGGRHWDAVVGRMASPAAFSADELLGRLAGGGGTVLPPAHPRTPATQPSIPSARRRSRMPGLVAALAASALVAVAAWSLLRPATPWGWNRADVFAATAPDAYLDRLAAGAVEWSAVQPATEAALAGRLREMLDGCDRLIAAPHGPLDAADREWLVDKCRAWREKLAGHLAALAESHDVAAVQREADATIEKLTAALRGRAAETRQRKAAA